MNALPPDLLTPAGQPILTSLLETDFYKFSMWQLFWRRHRELEACYRFVCRSTPAFPLAELLPALNEQLDALCSLRLHADELAWLGAHPALRPDFVAWLSRFRFERRHIRAWAEGGQLRIEASGPQPLVMAFEIFVLALVSELYSRRLCERSPGLAQAVQAEGRRRLAAKVARLQARLARTDAATAGNAPPAAPQGTAPAGGFSLIDFGLRRRFSGPWHREVVRTLRDGLPGVFTGTSSVRLAQELGLPAVGTMAHEYLQTYQALPGALRDFQRHALRDWWQEFGPTLAVALTDVIGMDAFLADFGPALAQRYAGLRHDSGDPMLWADKALAHYARLGIDARSKRLVFSDGLDLDTALDLHQRLAGRAQLAFGIGTHLTHDMGMVTPLNIVMKLVRVNGQAVAKLSDAPGKTLCDDPAFLARLRHSFAHALPA